MLYAEAESRDSNLFERFKLRFSQRARLALEGDFFSRLPAHVAVEPLYEMVELPFADIRRRAAAEVGEAQLPTLKSARAAIDFILFDERFDIKLDFSGVLVRVDFEVTELATLSA